MDGKKWGALSLGGIVAALVTLSQTNPELLKGWLQLLYTVPMPAWGILSCTIAAWVFPWCVEYLVPMADWGRWQFRSATWGAAVILGVGSAAMLWHSWYVLALWTVALAVQMLREKASETWPALSPRQKVIVGRNAAGDPTVKYGNNPTLVLGREVPAADKTVPGAAAVPK